MPEPAPSTSLLRVTSVGLRGSDLPVQGGGIGDAQLRRPLVLGHEFAAVVEEGPGQGQRVAVDPAMPGEICEMCREGHRNLCPTIRFAGHGDTDCGLRDYLT